MSTLRSSKLSMWLKHDFTSGEPYRKWYHLWHHSAGANRYQVSGSVQSKADAQSQTTRGGKTRVCTNDPEWFKPLTHDSAGEDCRSLAHGQRLALWNKTKTAILDKSSEVKSTDLPLNHRSRPLNSVILQRNLTIADSDLWPQLPYKSQPIVVYEKEDKRDSVHGEEQRVKPLRCGDVCTQWRQETKTSHPLFGSEKLAANNDEFA